MNIFTIDTDEYYPVCYKVNDAKTFENLVAILFYPMLANHNVYIADWLVYLGPLNLYWFSAVYYRVSLEGYQTMCSILFICKGPTSFIESINQSGSPKKNICWYGTQKLPKTYNYQTETAIFQLQSMKKQLWHAVIYIFFKYFLHFKLLAHNTIKMEVFI